MQTRSSDHRGLAPRGAARIVGGALALAVGAHFLAELAANIYESFLAARANADVGAAQRATILSVEGCPFSVTMIWAFPLVGWVAGRLGWPAAYAGAGGVVLLLLGAWLITLRGDAPMDAAAKSGDRSSRSEPERYLDGPTG